MLEISRSLKPALTTALLLLAAASLAAPKAPAKPDAKPAAPAAASPAPKTLSPAEIGHLDAVRLGVSRVETAKAWDRNAFPLACQFQDPRSTVKVPSPDGKKLLWRGLDKKGYSLFLSNADGSQQERLSACKNGYQPSFSPNGAKILFSAMDWRIEARNLFLYDIASGKSLRAFNAKQKVGPLAAFSPDGSKILFTYFDDLWVMNASGIGRSLLNVSGKLGKPVEDAQLIAWARDGASFCYQMRGDSTVYVVTLAPKS